MAMICERCKREMFKYETCDYCGRKIDNNCMKASQKISKTVRLVICKDDWSKMPMRSAYKNKQVPARQEAAKK